MGCRSETGIVLHRILEVFCAGCRTLRSVLTLDFILHWILLLSHQCVDVGPYGSLDSAPSPHLRQNVYQTRKLMKLMVFYFRETVVFVTLCYGIDICRME